MAQSRQSFPEPPNSPETGIPRLADAPPGKRSDFRAPSTKEFDALLTEIAQQALLTTRATGAAIALRQGSEIVCRATTGGHAPDLGAQLDTKSGLSGACVQSGRVQICTDTELDPRVDVEACRALGVRSILVAPLLYEDALVGVMELFSPVVHSFGERDIHTLEACAHRILEVMGRSEEGRRSGEDESREPTADAAGIRDPRPAPVRVPEPIRGAAPPYAAASPHAPEAPHTADLPRAAEVSRFAEPHVIEPPASLLAQAAEYSEPPRQRDLITTVLTGLVIGLAILFGSLIGLRMSRRQMARLPVPAPAPAAQAANAVTSTPLPQSNPAAPPLMESKRTTRAGLIDPARKVERADDKDGGLVVYQDDRVIFQLPPSQADAAASPAARPEDPVKLSPEVAGKLLASRVEPQYPDEALAAHVQGTVGVRLIVDRSGKVTRARVFSGPPELAQAAVDAVKQWTFRPYAPNGTPTDFETTAAIDFKLP
jgi:TonB family protein